MLFDSFIINNHYFKLMQNDPKNLRPNYHHLKLMQDDPIS
jgi:hypothetical protein